MTCRPEGRVAVIKLGGAALTRKESLHTVHDEWFEAAVTVVEATWRFREKGKKPLILIHGAGSFGHFEAAHYGINSDLLLSSDPSVADEFRIGFAKTRAAVTELNRRLVQALLERGVPAVSVSPFPSFLTCKRKTIVQAGDSSHSCDLALQLARVLDSGFLPVVHGDAVLDSTDDASAVLSGDTIAAWLSDHWNLDYVTFLSDVDGVYDRDPKDTSSKGEAKLFSRLFGASLSQNHMCLDTNSGERVETSEGLAHDVTGGMSGKLIAAQSILKAGVPVFVAHVSGDASSRVCCGLSPLSGSGTQLLPHPPIMLSGDEFLSIFVTRKASFGECFDHGSSLANGVGRAKLAPVQDPEWLRSGQYFVVLIETLAALQRLAIRPEWSRKHRVGKSDDRTLTRTLSDLATLATEVGYFEASNSKTPKRHREAFRRVESSGQLSKRLMVVCGQCDGSELRWYLRSGVSEALAFLSLVRQGACEFSPVEAVLVVHPDHLALDDSHDRTNAL